MAWTTQEVMDAIYQQASGEGYNETNAIPKYAAEHPEVGLPLPGREFTEPDWPYVLRNYANRVVAWNKRTGEVLSFPPTPAGVDSLPKA